MYVTIRIRTKNGNCSNYYNLTNYNVGINFSIFTTDISYLILKDASYIILISKAANLTQIFTFYSNTTKQDTLYTISLLCEYYALICHLHTYILSTVYCLI